MAICFPHTEYPALHSVTISYQGVPLFWKTNLVRQKADKTFPQKVDYIVSIVFLEQSMTL